MKSKLFETALPIIFIGGFALSTIIQAATVTNPIMWADIPDVSIVRVEDKYYMSHTTMHMNPGVPIMESSDMVHWKTISYCYQTHVNNNKMNLSNGENAYGKGSWASSIRYKDGTFYVLTFSQTSGSSHLYTTKDIKNGTWKETKLPFWHDPSLLLDDDGRNYVIYGGGDIRIVELNEELTGVKNGGLNKILLSDPAAVAGSGGLRAEGTQVYKYNGYYYVFNICWPNGGMRTEICSRGKSLTGTFESKVVLKSNGVAQGSIIEMKDGSWMGYLFQDNGAVGRSPWIMPVTWQNDWPVFNNGTAPQSFDMASVASSEGTGFVTSDDFLSSTMKLEWQFNHNPDNTNWTLSERPGFYRIKTGRIDDGFLNARNTLTQRSFGPKCSGRISLDVSGLKDGDCAGLAALQAKYGFVAVKRNDTQNSIVMQNGATQIESVPISQDKVFLRIDMDFTNRTDKATFYYSLDSTSWNQIGNTLQMTYDLAHFMGYRFALFNYATKSIGGVADFDWFQIGSSHTQTIFIEDGLSLNANIKGQGIVNRTPNNSGYKKGTSVILNAEPEPGWKFIRWSGNDIDNNANPLTVTMDTNKIVEALFARISSEDGNMVINGDFSSSEDQWTLNVWDGAASGNVIDGKYQFSIESSSSENYQIQLIQPGLFLDKGQTYEVVFDAFAASSRSLEVNVEMHDEPWESYLPEIKQFDLTSSSQTYKFTFTMEENTDVNGRIAFNVGKETPDVTIDNVIVRLFDPSNVMKTDGSKKNVSPARITCINSVLRIEIALPLGKQIFLEMFDMRGVVVKSDILRADMNTGKRYDMSKLTSGMYIVKLRNGTEVVNTSKIMISR